MAGSEDAALEAERAQRATPEPGLGFLTPFPSARIWGPMEKGRLLGFGQRIEEPRMSPPVPKGEGSCAHNHHAGIDG